LEGKKNLRKGFEAKMEQARRKERLDRGIKVRTEGIYAISSYREMLYLLAPRLTLVLGMLVLPLLLQGGYLQKVLVLAGIYALLAVSYDFLAHFTGLVCLGGALFVGVGGYIAGFLNNTMGWGMFLTIPIAAIMGALICTLLLLPALPSRGIYFAVVSFMYPLLLPRVIEALGIFGGTDGIFGLSRFPNTWVSQYTIILAGLVAVFVLRRLVTEDIGLVFRGVKDNDQAVRASGINITLYKAVAIFIAAMAGCFGGACLAHVNGSVGLSLFGLDFSILPIAATVVGGGGTLVGPFLGALLLTPLSEILRDFGTLRIVVYAIILAGFIAFLPEGLMSYLQRKYHQFERWRKV
jgi:branched-chain amino acid transport system permease protein